MELTAKQEKFCQLVAYGSTYKDAYVGAYNVGKNTSLNTMYVKSSRIMDESKINLRIQEIKDEIHAKSIATLDEILKALTTRVRLDVREMFNVDGGFKFIHDLTKEQASMLHEFQVEEIWAGSGDDRVQIGELKKVKFVDLKSVWDMFLKKFGAYLNTVEIKSKDLEYIKDLVGQIKTE